MIYINNLSLKLSGQNGIFTIRRKGWPLILPALGTAAAALICYAGWKNLDYLMNYPAFQIMLPLAAVVFALCAVLFLAAALLEGLFSVYTFDTVRGKFQARFKTYNWAEIQGFHILVMADEPITFDLWDTLTGGVNLESLWKKTIPDPASSVTIPAQVYLILNLVLPGGRQERAATVPSRYAKPFYNFAAELQSHLRLQQSLSMAETAVETLSGQSVYADFRTLVFSLTLIILGILFSLAGFFIFPGLRWELFADITLPLWPAGILAVIPGVLILAHVPVLDWMEKKPLNVTILMVSLLAAYCIVFGFIWKM